jgi:hypothetical protein
MLAKYHDENKSGMRLREKGAREGARYNISLYFQNLDFSK